MPRRPKLPSVPVPRRLEQLLDDALDKALAVQRPVIQRYLARTHAKNPGRTPAELVTRLERAYLTAVVGIGGAAGASAAVPGAGTVAGIASGAAEITGFISATATYVLALAELYGIPVSDPELRRALVVAVLVGEGAERVIAGTETGSAHWARMVGRTVGRSKSGGPDKETLAGINHRLTALLLTRFGARQGALLFGRALPLGIGAGVGAVGNAALARAAIASARRAFGPPPQDFPPRVVDGLVVSDRPRGRPSPNPPGPQPPR